jgi:hypothetical protein
VGFEEIFYVDEVIHAVVAHGAVVPVDYAGGIVTEGAAVSGIGYVDWVRHGGFRAETLRLGGKVCSRRAIYA